MLKHLKSTLASLLAAALLVSALAVPVAADTGAAKDTSFNHDIEQVQDIQSSTASCTSATPSRTRTTAPRSSAR